MATVAAVTAEEEADLETLDVGEGDAGEEGVDEELEAMKKKVKEMEDEAEKLNKIQNEVEEQLNEGEGVETNEADGRSIYIGNVDYSVTPEELQEHFAECGTVNRVTILCDKFRNPKARDPAACRAGGAPGPPPPALLRRRPLPPPERGRERPAEGAESRW